MPPTSNRDEEDREEKDTGDSNRASCNTGTPEIGEDIDDVPEDTKDEGSHRAKHEVGVKAGYVLANG